MSVRTCADCTTQYALDLAACPHCGSSSYVEPEGAVTRRLPLFVALFCPGCGRGPWTVRLTSANPGLIDLPTLACTSCGSRVPVTWPPEEEPMSPKITVHSGASNAREEDVSPASDASSPQDVAEDVLGHPTSVDAPDTEPDEPDTEPEDDGNAVPDYDSMTLAELRDEAEKRGVAAYGKKSDITERLRQDDAAGDPPQTDESE